MIAFHNLKLISNGTIAEGQAILVEGSQITAVVADNDIPAEAEKQNLNGAYVAPGFIDLQIYGSGGKLFAGKPEVAALKRMEDDLLNQGTTGFFATIGTNTDEIVEAGIAAAKEYRANARGNFWGVHLEGPYLNPARKGAHPEEYIKKATLAEVKGWIEQADGVVTMITIAPELQDQEVIDYLHEQGIIISSGHSNATYEQGKAFLNKPIPAVTHLFNAMPQMHHREPGYIPAIFEEKPYTSIVADGNHVDWPMIRLAKRELGNKLFLITDAVTAATEGAYQHRLEGNKYVMPDGTLSGSSLTMLKAVQNCVDQVGIELAEAVNMASLYPAQLAGKTSKGKIEAGYDADLIVFDNDYNTVATVLAGEAHSQDNIKF
ncbi:N-acetylglucosamine-6-phosphate deacetylase [Mucilaginibacter pallidiroseus]|uniref:N-acetylglucosamine-6-phosphate deacetylase n=1 Tax=Mucilaginibacter pallidiroseus TaxID=2599295 RepID=A0A563TXI7_9SPHI|nr:N-acetylglucosamine-6-phosphate deacetylase [Mucilaginibacter pallidiroseus]TWR24065.1 N-acetylglucosamine-6-phosphate deacetylase [Mucilaginibacter pallidiroseus]